VDVTAVFPLETTAPAWLPPIALGVAFGWLLERAGLGSARKIAGQFLLTDFTVVRVMFAAILTAGLGLFWLSWLGVVDLSRVYVPETFPLAQVVGGLVFGTGFAVGGLCPGTSCVAGASGRRDGIAVVVGLLAGTLLFAEAFPLLQSTYERGARGALTIPQALGVSHGAVLFLLALLAVALFALTSVLERRGVARAGIQGATRAREKAA
jgi:uncharacterized membrane protein YedE/YeeE